MAGPTAILSSDKPLVFISCGQYTTEEKAIGSRIAGIIRTHTDYEPYFAENQRSFEGLSNSILAALQKMSGMVVIMHRRGEVAGLHEKFQRGSVWIEQEIAIAAALQHGGRDVVVAAYVEDGIKREGLRDLLHLNPITFSTADEVVEDFEALVVGGRFSLRPTVSGISMQVTERTAVPSPISRFDEEASEAFHYAAESSGLWIPSFICSMTLTVHPSSYNPDLFGDDNDLRRIINAARVSSGPAFPIVGPERGVSRVDGVEVMASKMEDGPRQFREYYRVRRNGLFFLITVSPDDILDDRQFRDSDRFIGLSTLVGTLTRMGTFARSLSALFGEDTRAAVGVAGLGGHRLVDDTADSMLSLDNLPVAREDRYSSEFLGSPEAFKEGAVNWAADVIVECLRLLNFPYVTDLSKATVLALQARVR